jgi:hypothetical protein
MTDLQAQRFLCKADAPEVFRCTPSWAESPPPFQTKFGRDHLTDEQRAELEELGLLDLEGPDGSPLILGVLEGRFGSAGIVTANRTLFPPSGMRAAVAKKVEEIESWRRSMAAGTPTTRPASSCP